MAEKSGFFNSVSGDRKYKADFFAEYFSSFIGNGIFPNPSTGLQVIADTGMKVVLKAGKAWINGYYYCNDSDLTLTLDIADGILNRIDKIVLQFNKLNRTITAQIKKGVFASNAVAPALQRDSDAYELALADINVGKGIVSITQSSITDLRLDNTKCGIVSGTVNQVDTTTLFNQYQSWLADKKTQYDTDMTNWTTQEKADYETWFNETTTSNQVDFETWFNGVKDIFDGDAVGNLTNKINALPIFQTAQGTGTAIILSDFDLENGNSKTFIVTINNNSAATTINGKQLYKPNTTTTPKLTQGKAVTVWYSLVSDCFFIKASAEGNAIAGHVLAGDTFSNDDDTGLIGTMANKGAISNTISAAGGTYIIPAGYHNGAGVITAPSLATVTSSGTVTSNAQILSGYKAYSNGTLYTGNIASKGSATYTPSTSAQTIASGQYLSGVQTIAGDANLIASNIISGASIFGVAGGATIQSLGGTNYAKGSYYRSSSYFTISGLNFSPNFIYSISSSHYYIYDGSCRFFPSAVVLSFTYSTAGGSISGYVYTATTNYFTINSDGFYWKCTGGSGDTVTWSAAVL